MVGCDFSVQKSSRYILFIVVLTWVIAGRNILCQRGLVFHYLDWNTSLEEGMLKVCQVDEGFY